MADYKAMYRHLFQQTEQAVRIIQQAQLDCEDIYINTPEPKFRVLNMPAEPEAGQDTAEDDTSGT